MLAFLTTIILLSLTPVYSYQDQAVDQVDLSLIKIESNNGSKHPRFEKGKTSKSTLFLNKSQQEYYDKLPDVDKKIVFKLVSLGLFKEIQNKNYLGERYTLLYKKTGTFNIETIAVVPMTYERALPVITDFASYNDWVIKDINIKRDGDKGKYFFDINSLKYFSEKDKKFLELNVLMTKLAKGEFRIKLLIQDSTKLKPVPFFSLKMDGTSDLAKNVEGTFKFIILPDVPYFIIYFTGKAEVGWIYYKFLPMSLIQSQFIDRIYTMLENIQYKAESVK